MAGAAPLLQLGMPWNRDRRGGLPLLCAALVLAACSPGKEKTVAPAPAPVAEPASAPEPPQASATLVERAELLDAVRAAAASYAAHTPPPADVTALAGRRFVLRLPFGCFGPLFEGESVGYAYDAEKQTLRIRARPQVWTDAPWARELVGSADTEAIEGFWIRRPWLQAESCPPTDAAQPVAGAPTPETVGLAQVFEKGGSRLLPRGGRAYEVTRKVEAADAPRGGNYRLVVQGRVSPPDNRPPVVCRSDHPDQRPLCLVRVEIDRVAFETTAGEVLAEWKG